MDPAFLRFAGVRHGYGARHVLEEVDLAVAQGEFVALLGPSGCGKTTLLNLTAGFLAPSAGDILLDGASVRDVPSHLRGIAMVFQNYALFPHMRVADNVGFGLRMQRVPGAERRRRVHEALALVQLPDAADKYPDALSGGQRQRVALARALVLRPRVLLLDEPLSNLDPALRANLRAELLRLHRLTGMTTVMVTHDVQEAFSVADRVAVMMHGRVQQYDAPARVYRRPANTRVADYFGLGNRLGGVMRACAGGHVLDSGGLSLPLPPDARPGMTVAVPAHALRLAAAGAPQGSLPARLTALTYLGDSVEFDVEVAGQTLRGVQPAGAWAEPLRPGDAVQAGWDVADLVVFPAEAPDATA